MSFALVMRRSGLSMGRTMARFESTATTTKAAEAAKQTASQASSTASEVSSKATQGLSRVTSAAGPAIANAAKGVSGALGRVGGRTGRLVAFVERKDTPASSHDSPRCNTAPRSVLLLSSSSSICCAPWGRRAWMDAAMTMQQRARGALDGVECFVAPMANRFSSPPMQARLPSSFTTPRSASSWPSSSSGARA
jgi:hypothetical protein